MGQENMPLDPIIPFSIEFPIEVWEKAGEPGKERRIGGIISTEHEDQQSETVVQNGLDFKPFLSGGWFNDNHSKDTTGVVGYPETIKRVIHEGRPAHYVEGYLLQGYPRADEIWKLGQALQKTNRRLGFSIEGGVGRRAGPDGKTIASATVRNVAITNCPVNTKTAMEILAKSLQAVAEEGDEIGNIISWRDAWRRSMAAGQQINDPGPAPGVGFPIRTESLEGDLKISDWERKRKRKRSLSKAEAGQYLVRRYPGISRWAIDKILAHVAAQADRVRSSR